MRLRPTLTLSLLLALTACGGGEEPSTWATPAEAAEAGAASLAAGDLERAAAAYTRAAEATEPRARMDALNGLYHAQLKSGQAAAAIAAAQRFIQEGGPALDVKAVKSLADAAILERNAEVANAVIDLAVARFPDAKASFAKAIAAVDALRTQGAGADLSALGYTGD